MYKVLYSAPFKRNLKKLIKKYPRIKKDLSALLDQLEEGVFQGDQLQGLSCSVYKVRVASIDQKKGKRGGFRVVYYVVTPDKVVYLMTIYAKAHQEDLAHGQKQEIKTFIETLANYNSDPSSGPG